MRVTTIAAAVAAVGLITGLTASPPRALATERTPHSLETWQAVGELHPGGMPDWCVAVRALVVEDPPDPAGGVVLKIPCFDPPPGYYVNWILIRHSLNGGPWTGEVETLANPRFCLGFGQQPLLGRKNRIVVIQHCASESPGGAGVVFVPFAGQWSFASFLGLLSVIRDDSIGRASWQKESRKYLQTFITPKWHDPDEEKV